MANIYLGDERAHNALAERGDTQLFFALGYVSHLWGKCRLCASPMTFFWTDARAFGALFASAAVICEARKKVYNQYQEPRNRLY